MLKQNTTRDRILRMLLCRAAGLGSGLLMMVGHLWGELALLQLIALLPVLWVCGNRHFFRKQAVITGLYLGLSYTIVQLVFLQMPPAISAILITEITLLMMLFALGSTYFLRKGRWYGFLFVGAALTVVDWLNFTAVPIWGLSQSFFRPWSFYPAAIQFISFTGISGIGFILGTFQAAIIQFALHKVNRVKIAAVMIFLVLLVCLTNGILWFEKPAGSIRVASVGWTQTQHDDAGGVYSDDGFTTLYEEPVKQAAAEGAKLVVSPECGFLFNQYTEEINRFSEIARTYAVTLAVGYIEMQENKNQMVFIDPNGVVTGPYTKTHLIPFENFSEGNGQPVITEVDGVSIGAMICQDDNFSSLTRDYGRKPVAIMAVPTLDWIQVKDAHYQGTLGRAIESRFGIVRAAYNGISAIIDGRGKIIAQKDHFKDSPDLVIGDINLYPRRTLFDAAGHWFVIPCALCIVFGIICAVKEKQP